MQKKLEKEINYCLDCPTKPCRNGCPLNNDIPEFIEQARLGNYEKAYHILTETTVLSSICGRICPFHLQCEGSCVRRFKGESVQIGDIEAFIGDQALVSDFKIFPKVLKKKNKRIAVVGAGPAGITCAAFLIKLGYDVDLYDKHYHLGGIISHGIPSFRLNPRITRKVLRHIVSLEIGVFLGKELGVNLDINELKNNYDAIFLGIGANKSKTLNISGINLKGVYGANELLEKGGKLDFQDKKVIVIGAGNVAMDMARTAQRLGAKTTVVYHRMEKDMAADASEYEAALKDGVKFLFETNVTEIIGKEKVSKVTLSTNGKDKNIVCDYVIQAIGSKPYMELVGKLNLNLDENGYIKVNNNQTSDDKIFAGGDIINETRTVAFAARSGRDAAYYINDYLK